MESTFAANPLRVRDERSNRLNFPRAFHVRLPEYGPTPLLEDSHLAADLGIGQLWVKDESRRFQMEGFELLGAAWALYRYVLGRLERRVRWDTIDELREKIDGVGPVRVVVVSDNHFARAAAWAARLFDFPCVAYVPAEAAFERLLGIEAEGADVVAVIGGYDAALAEAATDHHDDVVVLSDSSWSGFEEIPGWVTEGYTTVFEEALDSLGKRGAPDPDVVMVPLGVGALAASAGDYFRTEKYSTDLELIGVEPAGAPCFVESAGAGKRVAMPDPAPSVMQSIARGLPSPLAWDTVSTTFDGFLAIDDDVAVRAAAALHERGVDVSPAGAAALGGIIAGRYDLSPLQSVLVVVTEAAKYGAIDLATP